MRGGVPVRHSSKEGVGLWKHWDAVITLRLLQNCNIWKLPVSFLLLLFALYSPFLPSVSEVWVESCCLITLPLLAARVLWLVIPERCDLFAEGCAPGLALQWWNAVYLCLHLFSGERVVTSCQTQLPLFTCTVTLSFNPSSPLWFCFFPHRFLWRRLSLFLQAANGGTRGPRKEL